MMKILYNLIALVAIANMLIIGGLVGYLAVSDKLNADSAETIAEILRGEKMVAATTTAPATQPTTQPATPATAKEAPSFNGLEIQLARLEREKRGLSDRYARLRDAELKLIQDREALARREAEFKEQLKVRQEADQDEGFIKALSLYTQMPAKMAKDDFMHLDVDIVIRYLMNMKKQASAKILKEFKTPKEMARRQEILERIRTWEIVVGKNSPENKG